MRSLRQAKRKVGCGIKREGEAVGTSDKSWGGGGGRRQVVDCSEGCALPLRWREKGRGREAEVWGWGVTLCALRLLWVPGEGEAKASRVGGEKNKTNNKTKQKQTHKRGKKKSPKQNKQQSEQKLPNPSQGNENGRTCEKSEEGYR